MDKHEFVCPQNGLLLQRITGAHVTLLNDACRRKRILSKSGHPIKGPLSALWMRSDNAVLYVERDKIPILLIDESVVVAEINDRQLRSQLIL